MNTKILDPQNKYAAMAKKLAPYLKKTSYEKNTSYGDWTMSKIICSK